MIRDKRKSAEYFEKYIEYQKDRIATKDAKLDVCANAKAKRERINLSQIGYKVDLIFAEYSAGYSTKDLKISVESAIDTALDMTKISFESLLNILSLQVVLNDSYEIDELVKKHSEFISNDKLLNCLATYLQTKKVVWDGSFSVAKVFDELDKVVSSDKKDAELNKYLQTWYVNRKDTSWYDTDKNANEVYVGYWSFESAALAKVFGIDETVVARNEYYPSF